MTYWIDIACILFVSVAMNHLGLIGEIEHVYGHRLKVVNCPKCAAFWLTTIYGLWMIHPFYGEITKVLAISFLNAWLAIWLELGMTYIDKIYLKLYGKIITTGNDNAPAADTDGGDPAGSVSEL